MCHDTAQDFDGFPETANTNDELAWLARDIPSEGSSDTESFSNMEATDIEHLDEYQQELSHEKLVELAVAVKDEMEAMEEEEGASECDLSSMPKEYVKHLSKLLEEMLFRHWAFENVYYGLFMTTKHRAS